MSEQDRISLLEQRIQEMEQEQLELWQKPIRDIARAALESEIVALGRRLRDRSYWLRPARFARGFSPASG